MSVKINGFGFLLIGCIFGLFYLFFRRGMSRSIKRVLLILILVPLFVGVLISVSISYILANKKGMTAKYQMSTFYPLNNITKREVVTLSSKLGNSNVISFRNNEGIYLVVSEFTDKNFECKGSCFCGDSDRRSSSLTIGRSLFFIISSISSIFAVSISKEYFGDECRRLFSDSCDSHLIHAKVDDCSEKIEDESFSFSDGEIWEKVLKKYEFTCTGTCLDHYKPETVKFSEAINCNGYEITNYIEFYVDDREVSPPGELAVEKFRREELEPYCEDLLVCVSFHPGEPMDHIKCINYEDVTFFENDNVEPLK